MSKESRVIHDLDALLGPPPPRIARLGMVLLLVVGSGVLSLLFFVRYPLSQQVPIDLEGGVGAQLRIRLPAGFSGAVPEGGVAELHDQSNHRWSIRVVASQPEGARKIWLATLAEGQGEGPGSGAQTQWMLVLPRERQPLIGALFR